MDVQLLVTKTDFCLPNLRREMKVVGVECHVDFIEDNPSLVEQNNIRHSPSIFVDSKLAFRHQPTVTELRAYFNK